MANAVALVATALGAGFSSRASGRKLIEHRIEIRRFKFAPLETPVHPGDTVTWINRDVAPHTATALDNSWDTGGIGKGRSRSVLVGPGFAPEYRCQFHPNMKSTLVEPPEFQ